MAPVRNVTTSTAGICCSGFDTYRVN